ncbi:hypothetical protein GOY11_33905, partial [Pseudomonas aeruginosa]|nr:hypothetical protein [Pseudomonas aeruginosa]
MLLRSSAAVSVYNIQVWWNIVYGVQQTERAVMLRVGRVLESDVKQCLHVKIQYVNQVRKFDARLLTLDAPPQRFLTLDTKAVMVDAYAKWLEAHCEHVDTASSGLQQGGDEHLSQTDTHHHDESCRATHLDAT